MALDFKRWTRNGQPIAPIMVKVYVDREDLLAAARLLASKREAVKRGTIEATLRDYVMGYGAGYCAAIENDIEERALEAVAETLGGDVEPVLQSLVGDLFPEVTP